MFHLRDKTTRFGLIFVLLVLGACAGTKLSQFDVEDLQKKLPEDLQKKFSVGTEGTKTKKKTYKKLKIPRRRPKKDPVWIGEKLTYDVSYLGVSAGTLEVRALPHKTLGDRKVYHIRGDARSSGVFRLFYRLDDYAESFFDFEGFFSHRFQVIIDESKQTRNTLELFDYEKGEVFYWDRWDHKTRGFQEKKEYKEITPFTQDSISALYYLRVVPMDIGSEIRFPMVANGKQWQAIAKVLEREEMSTPIGWSKVLKIRPMTKYKGILKEHGKSYMWITDDDRRFLVRLEAKVKIGAVTIQLTDVELGQPPQ